MKNAIAYYRVSTDRQGQSGLGLEAQQESVNSFAVRNGYQVIKEYTEIESGKKSQRPQLQAALQQCKKEKAILIIAKLDRLARNVFFISGLIESGVEFIATDNPYANKLTIHILSAVAEYEREQISTRTKDALKAAKKRGVKLGKHGADILSKENKNNAKQFAKKMKPVILKLEEEGHTTIRSITEELNKRNIPTFRNNGQKWHLLTVQKLKTRIYNDAGRNKRA
jgi:DNA invertase Pin-like site-specific DNA recombinase